ncbi:hypothetical protein RIF29_21864 [Crotalaria pallida]|uniref:Uncharacterized protein n=1 Tax=Crotalaria pallida TaxID=3830 RepID=A0AAN9FC97_CROPI
MVQWFPPKIYSVHGPHEVFFPQTHVQVVCQDECEVLLQQAPFFSVQPKSFWCALQRKRNRDIHPLDDSEGNENVCPKKLREQSKSLTTFTPSMCQVKDDFALPGVEADVI